MIGVTTNDRSVAIWANSHHLCGEVLAELSKQRSERNTDNYRHKEEGGGRIKADSHAHLKIKAALDKCIHPLKVDKHMRQMCSSMSTLMKSQILPSTSTKPEKLVKSK